MKREEYLINFYDSLSERYEELYGEEQKEKVNNILSFLESSLDIKEKSLNNNKFVIVDLGCGVGIKDIAFIKKLECFKKLKIILIGIDISFESLRLNKRKRLYDFLINADIENFCFNKFFSKRTLLISVSSLQNMSEDAIKKILSFKFPQLHSVMFRSKGEDYWKNIFFKKRFRLIKKINNDLLFSNF